MCEAIHLIHVCTNKFCTHLSHICVCISECLCAGSVYILCMSVCAHVCEYVLLSQL